MSYSTFFSRTVSSGLQVLALVNILCKDLNSLRIIKNLSQTYCRFHQQNMLFQASEKKIYITSTQITMKQNNGTQAFFCHDISLEIFSTIFHKTLWLSQNIFMLPDKIQEPLVIYSFCLKTDHILIDWII